MYVYIHVYIYIYVFQNTVVFRNLRAYNVINNFRYISFGNFRGKRLMLRGRRCPAMSSARYAH